MGVGAGRQPALLGTEAHSSMPSPDVGQKDPLVSATSCQAYSCWVTLAREAWTCPQPVRSSNVTRTTPT